MYGMFRDGTFCQMGFIVGSRYRYPGNGMFRDGMFRDEMISHRTRDVL